MINKEKIKEIIKKHSFTNYSGEGEHTFQDIHIEQALQEYGEWVRQQTLEE